MPTNMRSRFTDTMVSTASPQRLVTMVYDRLVRDLHEAVAAIEAGKIGAANSALLHAQELVFELERALDPAAWSAARELRRLYVFVQARLVEANLRKTSQPVKDCLRVVEPLAAAWHEAYRTARV